jgi:hypothetical protein
VPGILGIGADVLSLRAFKISLKERFQRCTKLTNLAPSIGVHWLIGKECCIVLSKYYTSCATPHLAILYYDKITVEFLLLEINLTLHDLRVISCFISVGRVLYHPLSSAASFRNVSARRN